MQRKAVDRDLRRAPDASDIAQSQLIAPALMLDAESTRSSLLAKGTT
jgi:hypothetical protein